MLHQDADLRKAGLFLAAPAPVRASARQSHRRLCVSQHTFI
jgi:hypothetical protein